MGGMFGKGGSSPKQTPAEMVAANAAQPFLAEYNSGKLNAADQGTVNLADTNQTGAALQTLASGGMGDSSAMAQLVGTVAKGTSTGGMQSGAGSALDLNKLSLTQQILESDLQTGMTYLQISSGQAADLAGIQAAQSQELTQALGAASSSLASVYSGGMGAPPGTTPSAQDTSLDINAPYSGPGAIEEDPMGDIDFAYPSD